MISPVHHLQHFSLALDAQAFIEAVPGAPDDPVLIGKLWRLQKPKVYWREATITSHGQGQVMLGDMVLESRYLAQGLAGCERATVLAVTIGSDLPDYVTASFDQGEMYVGAIGDMIGSHGAEQLAQQFTTYLAQRALSQGLFATLRFSPGYGDWPLPEQRKIMDFLQHCQGQISLTENYLLEPVKSITALIGWSRAWQKPQYPQGNHGSGFCNGGHNCAACTTWVCRK